jgi:hypothetical protein
MPFDAYQSASDLRKLPKGVLEVILNQLRALEDYSLNQTRFPRDENAIKKLRSRIEAIEAELKTRKGEEGVNHGACVSCGKLVYFEEFDKHYPDCQYEDKSDKTQRERNAKHDYLRRFGYTEKEISENGYDSLSREEVGALINKKLIERGANPLTKPKKSP